MLTTGEFPPGSRVPEVPVAERLGVSRTPVRLALSHLEQEGLLVSLPRRGFAVREIPVTEIFDAYDVRGVLEGLACRLAIERGIEVATRVELEECLGLGESMLEKGHFVEEDTVRWSEMNARFHQAFVKASCNEPLANAIAYNARLPLVAPDAIAFKLQRLEISYRYMSTAQQEHRDIMDAVRNRQGARAEALLREHAYKSRENLRVSLHEAGQKVHLPTVNLSK